MKKLSAFSQLELMMLPTNEHTLIFEDEFMLSDTLNLPIDPEGISRFVTAAYPFKLSFTMAIFCVQGHMRVRLNLSEYELESNDILVTLPNSIGECIEFGENCRLVLLAFSGNGLSNINPKGAMQARRFLTEQALLHISDKEMEEFLIIYHLMRKKIQDENYIFKREFLMGCLQVLSCNGCNWMAMYNKNKQIPVTNRQQILFESFLEYVRKHYTQHREISFYADLMCITPKYLSQIVYKASGRYAGDWIKDYVILEAKALLKSGRYTVQQVSDLLNFANASFFGKYFKAVVGCSPRKYQME